MEKKHKKTFTAILWVYTDTLTIQMRKVWPTNKKNPRQKKMKECNQGCFTNKDGDRVWALQHTLCTGQITQVIK